MPRFNPEDYIDVQTRINRFWQEYPDGRIDTLLMSDPDHFDQVVFRASVYKHRDDQCPSVTGWAAEKAGGGGANQTSWHENGETSAIGRALANMGYATSQKDRPSREEMGKTDRQADRREETKKSESASPGGSAEGTGPHHRAPRKDTIAVYNKAIETNWSHRHLVAWLTAHEVPGDGMDAMNHLTNNQVSELSRDIINKRRPALPEDAELESLPV